MENLEIEYKVLVAKADFERLIEILKEYKHEEMIQVNTYYDTKDEILKSQDVSLRIRNIINKKMFIATLKETKKEGKLEHEFEIKGNDINYLDSQIIDILKMYNVNSNQLVMVGQLKTIRKEYHINDCLLCLDHNTYYDNEDYEIECEANSMNEAIATISLLLQINNIKYEKAKLSKQARARKANKKVIKID